MPRPKNKEELITAANTNYEKLLTMITGQMLRKKQNMTSVLMKRKRKHIGSVTKIFAMC